MQRKVDPEILDSLESDDPRAVRSRRDLQRINQVMGNHRWIVRQVEGLHRDGLGRVVELGAGDGRLIFDLLLRFPTLRGQALDLQPMDPALEECDRLEWLQGDLVEMDVDFTGSIIVANLFLHHFAAEDLARIGKRIGTAAALLACEPERRRLHLWQGCMASPLVNEVTRHDMAVSIHAGFRNSELIDQMGLHSGWSWNRDRTWFGAHRVAGIRTL